MLFTGFLCNVSSIILQRVMLGLPDGFCVCVALLTQHVLFCYQQVVF